MLLHGRMVFINGELMEIEKEMLLSLQQLADRRELPPLESAHLVELLRQWYNAGYLQFDQ
jgi:hypothetical protein